MALPKASGIGKLRHRVSLFAPTTSPRSALNERVSGYTFVAEVWASVNPLSSRELIAAQQIQVDVTHAITLRWYPGLSALWKIEHKGRMLNLFFAGDFEERQEYITALCSEYVPECVSFPQP